MDIEHLMQYARDQHSQGEMNVEVAVYKEAAKRLQVNLKAMKYYLVMWGVFTK